LEKTSKENTKLYYKQKNLKFRLITNLDIGNINDSNNNNKFSSLSNYFTFTPYNIVFLIEPIKNFINLIEKLVRILN
jgi:hypothetical protein